jgi:hypothetical protein
MRAEYIESYVGYRKYIQHIYKGGNQIDIKPKSATSAKKYLDYLARAGLFKYISYNRYI